MSSSFASATSTSTSPRGVSIDVLQGVNLDIPQGDFLALMGPSGSGKTTLLNLMGVWTNPRPGTLEVDGANIASLSGSRLSRWRSQHIGFVFQLYNLLPVLTAERNVELPLLLTKLSKAERRKRVGIALKVVGLADRAKHYPRQLSGGQEQRVGIARAIVTDPMLLLADEPTGDLDRKAGDEILDLLQTLNRDHGKTIVMVTDPHMQPTARSRRSTWRRDSDWRAGMKFLPLLWKNLWRKKFRTIFTLLSVFVAFVLFGLLMTIRTAFTFSVDIAGIDRLVLIHKVSLIMPLPVSARRQSQNWRGSGHTQHMVWRELPGPPQFLRPDRRGAGTLREDLAIFKLPPEQMKAWLEDRQGAIVGVDLAKRFRLEAGRPHPHRRHHLAAKGRRHHLGVQHRRHL